MIDAVVQQLADRLAQIDGVVAVVLGGSRARGTAHPGSDIDLGIYYHPVCPPSISALRRLAAELDDRHRDDLVTEFGGWGPWINGGGWLQIEGQPVDWLYRDLDKVWSVVEECCAGRPTLDHQPGHPHGFHNHIYLGELACCRPLYDPESAIAALKDQITPYPPLLKRALIDTHLWQADFALAVARKAANRNDVFYVSGCMFQCVACLVQVLYALNERFFVNEKGAIAEIESFDVRPPSFAADVQALLSALGTTSQELQSKIDRAAALVDMLRAFDTQHDV